MEARWREYYIQLLNGDEICKVGKYVRRASFGGNQRAARMREGRDNEFAKQR